MKRRADDPRGAWYETQRRYVRVDFSGGELIEPLGGPETPPPVVIPERDDG